MSVLNHILIIGMISFLGVIIYTIHFSKNRLISILVSGVILVLVIYSLSYLSPKLRSLSRIDFLNFNGVIGFIIPTIIGVFIKLKPIKSELKIDKTGDKQALFIPHEVKVYRKKSIKFYDKIASFLIYGGTGSGKTKSIGFQLLESYIINKFSLFIYDLKEFDYTKMAYYYMSRHDSKLNFYYCNFVDLSRTYRFNPIAPETLSLDDLVQIGEDLFKAYRPKDSKFDDWVDGGLAILQGLMVRFYNDFPNYCTLPHIANFGIHNSPQQILSFINKDSQAKALASVFVDSMGNEKQMTGYKTAFNTHLRKLAFNKNISYVLSGNDFKFDLIDPKDPKVFAVSNNYNLSSLISPLASMLLKISSRKFTMENTVPFNYFLDEATTFRIDNFEGMTSVLREYKVCFTFLTQSPSKIKAMYGMDALEAIETNFSNLFIGRIGSTTSRARLVSVFDKKEEIKKSYSSGSTTHGSSTGENRRTEKVDKYEPSYFKHLKPGHFVGYASNSNYNEFDMQFEMADVPRDIELPIVRKISQIEIDRNYDEIIHLVKTLI